MKKMPFQQMMELRRRLAAGAEPAALVTEVQDYGFDLDALQALQATVKRDGAAMLRFGGSVEFKTR